MRRLRLGAGRFLAALILIGVPQANSAIHVSPDGSDGNPGTFSEPFATLERARNEVRARVGSMTDDITVYLQPGDYFLSETLRFESRDSGTGGHFVIYRATGTPGSVRLLAARRVEGWTAGAGGVWSASVEPGWVFHSLYENNRPAWKARFPDRVHEARFPVASAPYLYADDGPGIRYRPGNLSSADVLDWDLAGAEIVISPWNKRDWDLQTFPVVGIETESRKILTKQVSRSDPAFPDESVWVYDGSDEAEPGRDSRYFLQGVPEFLDASGEYFLDRDAAILSFIPRDGDPNESEILAPVTETLLAIEGSEDEGRVWNLRFDGISFEAADFTDYYPGAFTDIGYTTGMVEVTGGREIQFLRCRFRNAGFTALLFSNDNIGHLVESCLFEDAAAGIWANTTPSGNNTPNRDHRFLNNLILRMGSRTHSPGSGIKLHWAENSEVAHCHIRDVARWGVSIRGRAANKEDNSNVRGGNVVRHTIVERAVQDSGDAGALHTASVSVNVSPYSVNTFRQMLVQEPNRHPSVTDPADSNGIFTDYESFGQRFEDVWIIGSAAAPYRANPVQGPNPPGLTPNHTFDNVSWEEGFDESRMEMDRICLRPDFPVAFLGGSRERFAEDFDDFAVGDLVGQQGWFSNRDFGPAVVHGVPGLGAGGAVGPAEQDATGVIASELEFSGGTGASARVPLRIEFDLLQLVEGSIPSVGVGSGSRIPAMIGVNQRALHIRSEGFGTLNYAFEANGSPFLVTLGTVYRIRSDWDFVTVSGKGRLWVRNDSAGGEFRQLYFSDGIGGLTQEAPLDASTFVGSWDRVWIRMGSGGQSNSRPISPVGAQPIPLSAWSPSKNHPEERLITMPCRCIRWEIPCFCGQGWDRSLEGMRERSRKRKPAGRPCLDVQGNHLPAANRPLDDAIPIKMSGF